MRVLTLPQNNLDLLDATFVRPDLTAVRRPQSSAWL